MKGESLLVMFKKQSFVHRKSIFYESHIYRLQRSWAKVMFLQASVILSTGEGCASVHAGIPPPSRHPPPGADTPREQTPPWSRHPLGADTLPGADTPPEQTPPWSRHPPRSRHPWEQTPPLEPPPPPREQKPHPEQTPPTPRKQTQAYGQRAAGTHPTGMHSCFS